MSSIEDDNAKAVSRPQKKILKRGRTLKILQHIAHAKIARQSVQILKGKVADFIFEIGQVCFADAGGLGDGTQRCVGRAQSLP